MTGRKVPPAPSIPYGAHPDHVANLHLPAREGGPWPCVVLIHGGFWRVGGDRTLMTPLASDLARRGIAAWNVEYRRVGEAGGGWPGTFDDVAAAVDHLLGVREIDPQRIVTCGHSAGGQLALWAAARPRLPDGAPGSRPRVRARGAVALAAVCDLERAWRDDLGAGAVAGLVGSFDDVQDRYALASPSALRPLGVRQLIVHGTADEIVPLSQSRDYAGADTGAEFIASEGADHFDVVDPAHPSWKIVVDRLRAMLGARISALESSE